MKIFKISFLLLFVFFLYGCEKDDEYMCKHISNQNSDICIYDGYSAAEYLLENRNNNFRYFANIGDQNTNIINQSIIGGYINSTSQRSVFNQTKNFNTHNWYYNSRQSFSSNWIYPNSLYNYIKDISLFDNRFPYRSYGHKFIEITNNKYFYPNINQIQIGDILFLDTTRNGTFDYVFMVTYLDFNNSSYARILLSSFDTRNISLNTLHNIFPHSHFEVYRPTAYVK